MLDTNAQVAKSMMSDSKFFSGYSRWIDDEGRYETWDESVSRVMNMHREKYKDKMTSELSEAIEFAENKYKQKKVVGSQRAFQFGGDQIFAHELRSYNCSFHYIDRPEAFQESMYALLCGVGVGFSVQKHHIANLPNIKPKGKKTKLFVVKDEIEGWSDAFGALFSSYCADDTSTIPFPEYQGCHIAFDFSRIRPKGAHISGGFKAPGPDGLRQSLVKCQELLDNEVKDGETKVRPIVAYDFIMHMADAVLSGGVEA